MKNFYLLIAFTLLISSINAQWKQTKGPGAGRVTAMLAVGNDLYVSNRDYSGSDGRIYRSTDLGNSWFAADNGLTYTYINQFEHIGNTLFSATSGGVFRTQNAGQNWVLKYPGSGNVLSMTHRDSILFIGQEGPGVKVSYDLGNTWIPRNNGFGLSVVWVLSMERMGRYVYAGVANGGGPARLYRTSSDGLLWTLVNSGLPEGANPVDFTVNGSTIFVSTHGVGISGNHEYGVYRSMDSGYSWSAVNNGLPNNVVGGNTGEIFTAYNDLYVSTTYPFNEPMIYKSINNGISWSVVGASGFRKDEPAFAFAAAGGYVFSGLAGYSSVFRTANAGNSWQPARKGLANSAIFSLMKQNGKLYAGSQEGLHYSIDRGENWTQVDDPLIVGLPVTTMENNATNIFLGTGGRGIYRSTDNGTTWSNSSSGLNGTYADEINDLLYANNTLFAATWEGIYKSTNNGTTWTLSSTGLPIKFGGIVQVNTLAAIGSILYAGTVLEKVYKSTDNGATWILSGNGLSTYASTIHQLIAVGNDLYAATEDGVYKSTNQGAIWSFGGLAGLVQKLETNGRLIFASKYGYTILTGNGIYVSANKGTNWHSYTTGMNSPSSVRALLLDKNILYGGTDTRSVWVRDLRDTLSQNFYRNLIANESNKNFPIKATNPFENKIDVQLAVTAAGTASVYLFNSAGKIILQKKVSISPGNNLITLETGYGLTNGIYLLKVSKDGQSQSVHLLKE